MNTITYLLLKYPEKPWDWHYISMNPNLTMEFIEKYPEKPWNWYGISRNPNITMGMIEKHPEKPWHWDWISRNPNMTMEFIEKNIDKIDFKRLSLNKFTFENIKIKKKEVYMLLEKDRSFHKLMNMFVVTQYM